MLHSSIPISAIILSCLAVAPVAAHGQTLATLYSFKPGTTDAAGPFAPLTSAGGRLYGTTQKGGANSGAGTVFTVNPVNKKESVLHSFGAGADGANPANSAGLVSIGGLLYGTTAVGGGTSCTNGNNPSGCGTIFSVNPVTGAVTTVYRFAGATDGALPQGSLTALNGILYGLTELGGSSNVGTIFAFNPATGTESVAYSFAISGGSCLPLGCQSAAAGLTTDGSILYGAEAQVFSFNPGTGILTPLYTPPATATGAPPRLFSAPLYDGGMLYGTTQNGGTGSGSVYAVNIAAATGTTLYAFKPATNKTDAYFPDGGLIDLGGTLYGAAVAGGTGKAGALYSINPTTGAEQVLFSFVKKTSGAAPDAALIDVGGTLYGVTEGYSVSSPTAHPPKSAGTVFGYTP